MNSPTANTSVGTPNETAIADARSFLAGAQMKFAQVDEIWKTLKKNDALSLARRVLEQLKDPNALIDQVPAAAQGRLCQQRALLTSKDPELSALEKHDLAIAELRRVFDIDNPALDRDAETLGIAGGIYKRRWDALGLQLDLERSLDLYTRAASNDVGCDAYPHINAAFVEDVLAGLGVMPALHRQRATDMRERILRDLTPTDGWFNSATRLEALIGLGRYPQAIDLAKGIKNRPDPWELQTTIRQLARVAYLRAPLPQKNPELQQVFEALIPGATGAIPSMVAGKFGIALSGGGFRASFFHLGLLARLAELDVLRHVEVLSCVSGGSVVGATYWLMHRRRILNRQLSSRDDYIALVHDLIDRFREAESKNVRAEVQPGAVREMFARLAGDGTKGLLSPERTAEVFDRWFYQPLLPAADPIRMRDLAYTPPDFDPKEFGGQPFHPTKHNWLRENKVPILVLNATTINTGHAWHFTPHWMGESPWAVQIDADSSPRLDWFYYEGSAQADFLLGRAVAASSCVPLIFEPLAVGPVYEKDYDVRLVDGGVHDNQGTVALLAHDCDLIAVSDASGQLLAEPSVAGGLIGSASYGLRLQDMLMERIRWANFGDLRARRRSGQLKGLMFAHMKAGLRSDVIRPIDSQDSYTVQHSPLSAFGIRRDFQMALSELRTDLDAFSDNETNALMACGYQMARAAWERDLEGRLPCSDLPPHCWQFDDMLKEITSIEPLTPTRQSLLQEFRQGKSPKIKLLSGGR
jgi:predicted acylesterase/phospholipase RssA